MNPPTKAQFLQMPDKALRTSNRFGRFPTLARFPLLLCVRSVGSAFDTSDAFTNSTAAARGSGPGFLAQRTTKRWSSSYRVAFPVGTNTRAHAREIDRNRDGSGSNIDDAGSPCGKLQSRKVKERAPFRRRTTLTSPDQSPAA
ncbi:MAG: hypothetical protein E5V44_00265, partial [Mesorhizobium sp.]